MDASVVFLGRNASIMALVKHQLTRVGHFAEGFTCDEELMLRLERGKVTLLILGPGVEDGPRNKFRTYCAERDIPLLEHSGGPDQLLENVRVALGQ
ncbi:MAG: hypothetical protein IPH53_15680 [Flavobacteriales bacterium]|jgi:hypothetical protein|nr:hypothetical protein [Flavobacteriales bacterium]MBK7086018.1 hypothetical protein [Flavobacteriales bacterium]MBK7269624.1 hypothetical protein [Flavobacteriales bacterium]MBK7753647.1 hypothetical protein [Flavobacteriales bacterium]MBK9074690.1 hypothetical protein [Flavobacteriales bacterium]